MTEAEAKLWSSLRGRSIDSLKFRRQHMLGRYIVDFVCLEKRLVVEVDGGQHAHDDIAADDRKRTLELEAAGYRVLRVWNIDVLTNLTGVVACIAEAATSMPSAPRHQQRNNTPT